MDTINYEVYIMIDNNNNNIIGIESTASYQKQKLIDEGYIFIDEGADGEEYGRAQVNYLEMKYGKSKYDEYYRPNFKYENGQIIMIEEKDKEPIPSPSTTPSQEERLQALESAMLEMVLGGTE